MPLGGWGGSDVALAVPRRPRRLESGNARPEGQCRFTAAPVQLVGLRGGLRGSAASPRGSDALDDRNKSCKFETLLCSFAVAIYATEKRIETTTFCVKVMGKFVSGFGNRCRFIWSLTGQIPDGLHRRSLQTLAFEDIKSSSGHPHEFTAFIVHGLLGSGRNWRSFSRSLATALLPAQWRFVVVDLRNHGKSAELDGFFPPHDLDNAAKDLANLINSKGWKWPDVVIGHSLGGKVALQFAQSCATGDYGSTASLPKQLWVLDSVPGKLSTDNSNGEVEKVLETLQSLPSTIPSRRWLVDHLIKLGFSKSLSEWLGTNLKKDGERETWAFHLDGAVQMFRSYRENDYWNLLEHAPKGTEIHMLRAEKSDRWTPDVIHQLEIISQKQASEDGGKVSLHVLPHAGHWVHVDNPKGLLQIMAPKVASVV